MNKVSVSLNQILLIVLAYEILENIYSVSLYIVKYWILEDLISTYSGIAIVFFTLMFCSYFAFKIQRLREVRSFIVTFFFFVLTYFLLFKVQYLFASFLLGLKAIQFQKLLETDQYFVYENVFFNSTVLVFILASIALEKIRQRNNNIENSNVIDS